MDASTFVGFAFVVGGVSWSPKGLVESRCYKIDFSIRGTDGS
jgi:hypothetical protein